MSKEIKAINFIREAGAGGSNPLSPTSYQSLRAESENALYDINGHNETPILGKPWGDSEDGKTQLYRHFSEDDELLYVCISI